MLRAFIGWDRTVGTVAGLIRERDGAEVREDGRVGENSGEGERAMVFEQVLGDVGEFGHDGQGRRECRVVCGLGEGLQGTQIIHNRFHGEDCRRDEPDPNACS